MSTLGESQDVEGVRDASAAPSGVAAPPQEGHQVGILSRYPRLQSVVRFLSAPFDVLPPAPKGRWPRIALILVGVLVLIYVVYFTAYTWAVFDAFRSNAEDMGIMDQALWTTLHGALLHQTICNNISDSNCLGDISRFAIHFEPLMLPISLLYLVAPSPKTLMLLQALIVGCGAFPLYWMATRRLQSPLAGVGFALAYLLYPALQSAEIFDFHAVTLAVTFLMFALYFMLTRNNVGLVISCVLALATKEEIPVDVIMIGLAIIVFQRRSRVGVGLIALSLAWLAVSLAVMHGFSPLGHSSTASRYSYLGGSPLKVVEYVVTHPVQLLKTQVFSSNGRFNIHESFGALAYLGVLSPSVAIMAIPALAINLLSSDPRMQMGIHQYSAELIPFMFLAAISSVAFLLGLLALIIERTPPLLNRLSTTSLARQLAPGSARGQKLATSAGSTLVQRQGSSLSLSGRRSSVPIGASHILIVVLALLMVLFCWKDNALGDMPSKPYFAWPVTTAHNELFSKVAALIPPNASVSAQDTLVPHLSHRRYIYQYPYMASQSDYVVLDTSGNIYPFPLKSAVGSEEYHQSVKGLLNSGEFRVIFSEGGYLVLQRIT
jgi:uncharacterized membrane protein